MSSPEIRVVNDAEALSRVAAEEFKRAAQAAIEAKGRFTVALAGGSTPKGLYSQLAKSKDLPWDKIYFFFGDERHVPPEHPESNYRMVNEALFSRAPVPPDHIFRMPTEDSDAKAVAEQYERALQHFFTFSRHCRTAREFTAGGRKLGAEIQCLPPKPDGSGTESNEASDVSRQWERKDKCAGISPSF